MTEKDEGEKNHNIFFNILLAGVLITIITSFYSFYYKKNYDFFVETKCNPEMEACFYRDCEGDPELCPPNNLSYYNQYTIKAKDFRLCPNEDCTSTCESGVIACEKTECTEDDMNNGLCVFLPTAPEELISPSELN